MKKFLILLLGLVITLFLSVFILVRVYEDRFVDAFKKQIIDKTGININFSEIHFSIFRNIPYGTFILDDVQIFYSKENRKDTLINAQKISFKINTLNLFRSIYEFPEIIITDGKICLYADKLDLLLTKEKTGYQLGSFQIETQKINLIRCWIKYHYKEIVKLNFYLDHSNCSGSYLSDALVLKLNLNIYTLSGTINNTAFKTKGLTNISTTIIEKDGVYRSNNGLLSFQSIPLNFAFVYTLKTDALQLSSWAKNISAKDFGAAFLNNWNIGLSRGALTFESFYSISLNNLSTQKLSVKYEFKNFAFTKYKDFSLSKLKGTTYFSGDFDKNSSEIDALLMNYLGLEIEGSLKIKNLLHPVVLLDCRFRNTRELNINKSYPIKGAFSGSVKSLIKLNDIDDFNINTLNVLKLSSEINFSNLSVKNLEYQSNLEGSIIIDDSHLQIKSNGLLCNTPFKGTLSISNFLDVAFHKAIPIPKITLELDRLNLDSIPLNNISVDETTTIRKYSLTTNIKTLVYKGITIKDLSLGLKNDNGKFFGDQFSLKALKGGINGNFIYSQREGYLFSFMVQRIDIQDLFNGFNNFGQNTITNKNISGLLSGHFDLTCKQFTNGKVNPLSVKLASNIVIENGRLIGVSQLVRISKFLNLREVDSIHFKSIRNIINIENGIITIPSMNIASSAMNFRLTGQHQFNGEFTYWVKLNLGDILAKKYLSHKLKASEYEVYNNNGLNLYLKIKGNNDSYKVRFDKKNTAEQIKEGFNQEGRLLKNILREEFGKLKKDSFLLKDALAPSHTNKIDSIHNKKQKKPFKIEWDELDSTKFL